MKVIFTLSTFTETVEQLKKDGYTWASGFEVSKQDLKKCNDKAKYFIIDAFFNNITNKKEMQFETERHFKQNYNI